jgi:hypothetical protein
MTKPRMCLLSATLVLAASCPCMAFADGRSTGQTIEYEIAQTITTKTDLSSLPAGVRARAEQNQAAANGKKTTTNLTMIIDSIDADGNAHVNAKFTLSMEGVSGTAATVFAGAHEFQGTFSADGRVLPTVDPNASPTTDSHGRYTAANAPNVNARQIQGTFLDFNAFITGASKRPKFKTGDVWHLSMQDAVGITRQYDFSVLELDSANSAIAVISMKGEFSGESSFQKISASGRYDAMQKILTVYHEENVYGSSLPNGMSSSSVMVEDIKLRK